jgi:hypothetical protein
MSVRGSAAPLVLLDTASQGASPEAIFQALDGHDCEVAGHVGHVAVYGIHYDGCCLWMQLAMDGEEPLMLTLRRCSAAQGRLELVSELLIQKVA